MSRPVLVGCVVLLAVGGIARGGPNDVMKIELTPAAAPTPALRFTLLPRLKELSVGNAAPLYRKASASLARSLVLANDTGLDRAFRWLQMPRQRFRGELAEAKLYLKEFESVFVEFEAATCQETCDWGLLEQFQKNEDISDHFNDVNRIREFVVVLQVRSQVALAEDRHADALRNVQMVFRFSRQFTTSPTLLDARLAMAFASIARGMVEEILQHPQTPNLYWALTDLPRPIVDLRPALEGERYYHYGRFPGLARAAADLNAGAVPAEKLGRYFKLFAEFGLIETNLGDGLLPPLLAQIPGARKALLSSTETLTILRFTQEMHHRHEGAKRMLITAGRPQASVDEMPPLQVALLHAGLDLECLLDEVRTWQDVPLWEAKAQIERLHKRMRSSHSLLPEPAAVPVAWIELRGIAGALLSRIFTDRHLAMLRCIEACRLYAAAHGGQLPPTLDSIKEVPIPLDPMTGKPFEYIRDGDRARLSAVVIRKDHLLPGVPFRDFPTRTYDLTIRR